MESKNNKIQNLFGKKNGIKVYNMINDLEMEQWKKIEVELENIPGIIVRIVFRHKFLLISNLPESLCIKAQSQ